MAEQMKAQKEDDERHRSRRVHNAFWGRLGMRHKRMKLGKRGWCEMLFGFWVFQIQTDCLAEAEVRVLLSYCK